MESFELLAQQYKPMIHKIINSLHIYKNIEEFYQHGLIALWEASRGFDPAKGNFTNYAYTYIKCFLQQELSKANKDEERSIYPQEEFWETVEDLLSEVPLEEEILLSYCSTLTENQRKWVMYSALCNFSTKEIAEIEKVSLSAVKNWRAGTRAKIKGMVKN
ncbi:sigma-70 family RNA polymerase sigma factor [Neobacillus ginsengisoli]|uniref:DNA-directed RNA polymerase n=1 Tax=Neobacillus ginsengisoli TaxID=904295 RepID=A0ABT9Y269_9BACI|nr:sigma-70 family RNA polymerase sigma factor [Neobacillus ginsengisoli]MDQ0201920.1 DNA-directed RNA polymerase [Neobacillus ginsengisoli]